MSITLVALLLEALALLGLGGARANAVKNKMDSVALASFIPASTFAGVMLILQAAAMFKPEWARKVNGRLGAYGLRL